MNKTRYIILIITTLIFLVKINITFSQCNIKSKEDVQLTTDRITYLSGETINFIADYKTTGKNISQLSNILYIELYDKRKSYVKLKYKIVHNQVKGIIKIPEDLLSGNYYLRAYTKFQRNFEKELFEIQLISVLNPTEAFPKENIVLNDKIDLKIFKADKYNFTLILRLDKDRLQKTEKITFYTSNDRIIKEIKPLSNGLAIFKFNQNTIKNIADFSADSINIKATDKDNSIIFDTKVNNVDSVHFRVNINYSNNHPDDIDLIFSDLVRKKYQDLKLNVYSPDMIKVYNKNVQVNKMSSKIFGSNIFEKTGFYYFMIKDNNNKILYFIPHYISVNNNLKSEILSDKEEYKKREKVSIQIKSDQNSDMQNGIIEVIKKDLIYEDYKHIPHYLTYDFFLLKSYLKGKTINDKFYRDQINSILLLNSDQFNTDAFKKIFTTKIDSVKYLPDTRGISVSGHVTDKISNTPVSNTNIFASLAYGENQIHIKRTNKEGKFLFSLNNAYGEQNLFLTAVKDSTTDIEISLDNDFHESYYFPENIPLLTDTTDADFINDIYISYQLNNYYEIFNHTGFKKDYNKINLEGIEDAGIIIKDYINIPKLEEIFNEIVPYVSVIKKGKKGYRLKIYNEVLKSNYENPLILVDYLPIFDIEELMKVNPKKIKKISVINQKFIIGEGQFNGIILIETNTKDFADVEKPKHSIYRKYLCLQKHSVYNPPKYDKINNSNNNLPDFRNLLFFKSYQSEIPKQIDFYTSDVCGEFEILFKGITKTGEVINISKTITVK